MRDIDNHGYHSVSLYDSIARSAQRKEIGVNSIQFSERKDSRIKKLRNRKPDGWWFGPKRERVNENLSWGVQHGCVLTEEELNRVYETFLLDRHVGLQGVEKLQKR